MAETWVVPAGNDLALAFALQRHARDRCQGAGMPAVHDLAHHDHGATARRRRANLVRFVVGCWGLGWVGGYGGAIEHSVVHA